MGADAGWGTTSTCCGHYTGQAIGRLKSVVVYRRVHKARSMYGLGEEEKITTHEPPAL